MLDLSLIRVTITTLVLGLLVLTGCALAMRLRKRDRVRLFPWSMKSAALARCGHRCEHKSPLWFRCRETHRLQADHITPWSWGGRTDPSNLQILCPRHNRRKSSRLPTPLYRWRLMRRRKKYRHA